MKYDKQTIRDFLTIAAFALFMAGGTLACIRACSTPDPEVVVPTTDTIVEYVDSVRTVIDTVEVIK